MPGSAIPGRNRVVAGYPSHLYQQQKHACAVCNFLAGIFKVTSACCGAVLTGLVIVCHTVCVRVRCITLNGEGNVLYPLLASTGLHLGMTSFGIHTLYHTVCIFTLSPTLAMFSITPSQARLVSKSNLSGNCPSKTFTGQISFRLPTQER